MAPKHPQQQPKTTIKPSNESSLKRLVGSFSLHNNVGGRLLNILESDIRVCLMTYLANLRERGGWQAPLGILLTAIITLLTSNFQDKFRIPKETWEALFIMLGIISSTWFIYSLVKRPKEMTIDDIIEKLFSSKK